MPYHLEKSGKGYFVVDNMGLKLSRKPIPKKRAIQQIKAVYMSKLKYNKDVKNFWK